MLITDPLAGRRRTSRGARRRLRLIGLLIALVTAAPLRAQEPARLSLQEALARAEALAYPNRVARGTAATAAAQTWATLPGILPAVRLEAGMTRTTDPIGAFGITMRQRRLGTADFDPNRLNDPAVAQNVGAGVVVEQPLFNPDAWLGRRAASLGTAAASRAAAWSAVGTRVHVITAYHAAILASAHARTLETAQAAAFEHARVATSMVEQGLATRSDALLASVRAGEIETQRLEATANVAIAHAALALTIGTPDDTAFTLPAGLPDAVRLRALAERALAATPGPRDDVEAARLANRAADADLDRARSLYLPRLNSFARYDFHARSQAFAGSPSWTVGVMASWSLFAGGLEEAERRAAGARRDVAEAEREAALAAAELDAVRTATTLRTALARLRIAEQAVTQSAEAQRIVGRKYAGGLATVVELLDAAAVETRSRLGAAQARFDVVVAIADRLRAVGEDPAVIAQIQHEPADPGDAPPRR